MNRGFERILQFLPFLSRFERGAKPFFAPGYSAKNAEKCSQFLVNILESVCHPILVIDPNTYEILLANSAAVGSRAVGPKVTCHALTHRRDEPCGSKEHPCPLEMTKKNRRPCSVEHVHEDAYGNKRYVEVHANPIFNDNGKILYIIEYAIDITARKQALLRTESQNKFLQLLLDTIPMPVFYKNHLGIYVGCNGAFCEYLGKPKREILGNTVFGIAPTELAKVYHEADLDLMKNKKSQMYETQVLHSDGQLRDVVFYKAAYDTDDGQTGLIGILLDITERKAAERERSKNEQRLTTIFEAIQQGIVVVDPVSHEILDVNPSAEKMIGLNRDQIVGKVCHEFICSAEKGKCPITDLNQAVDCAERELINAEGKRIKILKSVRKIDLQFRTVLLESFTDISRQKHVEEELLEAKSLLEDAWSETEKVNRQLELSIEKANLLAQDASLANIAKSEFLANMSHEIRTPINAIVGFGELLCSEELSPRQQEYVEIINSSTESLLNLINDILDFSKIEAGQVDLEIIPCSIQDVIGPVISIMTPQAEKKKLHLEVHIDEDIPTSICLDPTRIKQCLMNLISNAIKFTEEGGQVRVTCERDEIVSDGRAILKIAVSDTGIGIEPDKQKQIFDPFSQADSSTTRKFGGTGLGLTITKNLTEMMGGSLGLESASGQGATFTLMIPYTPAGQDTQTEEKSGRREAPLSMDTQKGEPDPGRLTGNILVAEDNASNQMLIRKLLEKTGCSVTIVSDGKQAIDAVKEGEFTLILMDMQMPVMNGYQAARSLRNQKVETPIIALTANAMSGDRDECLAAGCTDYLAKPLTRKVLHEILKKYLLPEEQTA